VESTARLSRQGFCGRLSRWALLALVVAMVIPAAAAAQGRFVYVTDGAFAGNNDVVAFRINANGTLSTVTGSPFDMPGQTVSEGLAITPDAENVYVANFGTDRISGFNVNPSSGALSAATGSPYGPGSADTVLGVAPDPDGGHLFAWNHQAAAGPSVGTWTINGNGSLTEIAGSPNTDPPGNQDPFAGSVSPDGDHLYVPMENTTPPGGNPDQTSIFNVAANGALAFNFEVNTDDAAVGGGNPFGSGILPNGQCFYVSAPEDAASVGQVYGFSVQATGGLVATSPAAFGLGAGNHPLTIAAAPDSAHIYVATRQSGSVVRFTVNADCTLSSPTNFATGGTQGKSLAFTPDGSRLYVANSLSDNISGFNVDPDTGALSLIPGLPQSLPAGADNDLEGIVITPNQPPVAAFSPTTLAPAGQASSFSADAASDTDGGTILRYDWDFGDGSSLPDGGANPTHMYTQPGTYDVQLTVFDNEGCSTERIFTGKAMLCNGNGGARISQQVTIQQAQVQPPAQCIVPNVVKKKKKKATAAIVAANCTVGAIKKKFSSKVKKKKVIKTKPKAGTTLPAGSPVDLKVSKGEKKG
jgi:sugar lactone lactonase YvrE